MQWRHRLQWYSVVVWISMWIKHLITSQTLNSRDLQMRMIIALNGQVRETVSFTALEQGFTIGRRLDPGSGYGVGWFGRLAGAGTPQMLLSVRSLASLDKSIATEGEMYPTLRVQVFRAHKMFESFRNFKLIFYKKNCIWPYIRMENKLEKLHGIVINYVNLLIKTL